MTTRDPDATGRPLTERERAVLKVLLSVDLDQVGDRLGGIEDLSDSEGEMPDQLPDQSLLDIELC